MTTETKTKPKCFADVKTPTTNAERHELAQACFVHVTGLPGVPNPPRTTWGTATSFPKPFTTILVTVGGEVWMTLRKPGEHDRNYNHVVKILAPRGTKHLLSSETHHFRAGELSAHHLMRRLSNPDYDPKNPDS